MHSSRHIIVPVFLNSLGCPSKTRCVFCNQSVSGGEPCGAASVEEFLRKFFSDVSRSNIGKTEYSFEIAFYGGTFTAIAIDGQTVFFAAAEKVLGEFGLLSGGRFSGFRVATRPDYINPAILSFLKERGVKTIEIGVESFDDKTLETSGRGYCSATAVESLKLIKNSGFKLSVHLMCGLPGQSREVFKKDVETAVSLAPDYARIHPLCVISGSALGDLYKTGKFVPRPDRELVEETAYAMAAFEISGVRVIRVGILENDKFRKEVLAGPAWPNLREIAEGFIHAAVYDLIREKFVRGSKIVLWTKDEKTLNYLIGYKKENIEKNNDLFLEFKNKMLYNNERIFYILISAENNESVYALTRPEILKQYITKF